MLNSSRVPSTRPLRCRSRNLPVGGEPDGSLGQLWGDQDSREWLGKAFGRKYSVRVLCRYEYDGGLGSGVHENQMENGAWRKGWRPYGDSIWRRSPRDSIPMGFTRQICKREFRLRIPPGKRTRGEPWVWSRDPAGRMFPKHSSANPNSAPLHIHFPPYCTLTYTVHICYDLDLLIAIHLQTSP